MSKTIFKRQFCLSVLYLRKRVSSTLRLVCYCTKARVPLRDVLRTIRRRVLSFAEKPRDGYFPEFCYGLFFFPVPSTPPESERARFPAANDVSSSVTSGSGFKTLAAASSGLDRLRSAAVSAHYSWPACLSSQSTLDSVRLSSVSCASVSSLCLCF